jgi:hypothetical protein
MPLEKDICGYGGTLSYSELSLNQDLENVII